MTAGLFAARGDLNIVTLIPCVIVGAIVGDATGYYIGHKAGQALYSRPDSFFFRREHLLYTQSFYERHGGKTIILARFMPIARTFAPVVAGAAGMTYRRFATFNVVGGILWVTSMCLVGFFLARWAEANGIDLEKNIHLLIAVVIFLSLVPAMVGWARSRRGGATGR